MADKTPQDEYVKVGEINSRYWVQGSQGSTVILIHGIGAAVDSWAFNINALAQKHRVYAIDLVGFGRSDKPSVEYSLPFFAQFVKDFMETQNINHASLVGWSLGGGVSLQFAIQFPERLDKLILLASMGFGREAHLMFRLSSIPWIGKILSRPSKKGTARLLKECVFDHTLITDELVDLYYQYSVMPGGHEAFLATLCNNTSFGGIKMEVIQAFKDNLGAISKPTLIIWGKQDRVLPAKHSSIAESWIPDARVHLIDDCGHCPQMEHPEEFNTHVLEFFDGLETERLVCYCGSCCHSFNNVWHDYLNIKLPFEIVSIWEWLWDKVQKGELKVKRPIDKTVAITDSCYSSQLGDNFYEAIRGLHEAAGMSVVELRNNKYDNLCCGMTTSIQNNFDLMKSFMASEKAAEKKIQQVLETKNNDFTCYCPGCFFQLRREAKKANIQIHYSLEEILWAFGDEYPVSLMDRASQHAKLLKNKIQSTASD